MPKSSVVMPIRKRSRREVKRVLEETLRARFPSDTVDVSDGYRGNVHIIVVSRKFDRLSSRQRADLLWKIIDQTDLSADEKSLISMINPLSPADLKS